MCSFRFFRKIILSKKNLGPFCLRFFQKNYYFFFKKSPFSSVCLGFLEKSFYQKKIYFDPKMKSY